MYVDMNKFIDVSMCALYMYVCRQTFLSVYMYTYLSICREMCMIMYVCVHEYMYVRACICRQTSKSQYMHVFRHMYMKLYVCVDGWM